MSKLLLLPFVFLGCLSAAEEPPGPPTPELLAAYGQGAELSCELHRALTAADPEANAFFSPTSIAATLALLAEGARGESQRSLAKVLQKRGELDVDGLRALRADLAQRLRAASSDIRWNDANGLWFDDQLALDEATKKALEQHYGASIEGADFRSEADEVRSSINAWVEDQTGDRIRDLLPSGTVDTMTRLLLVNAVYFLGKWEEEFSVRSTEELAFRRADGSESLVPFLRDMRDLPVAFFDESDASLPTQDGAALTMFELPYRGGQLSFVGLIPAKETGLTELEERITGALLAEWGKSLREQRVNFGMPKLKLEPSYHLMPVLQRLGLGVLLDSGAADLSGFFPEGSDGLAVTGAFHKAFLEVNEEGTEAAAATGIVAGVASAAGLPPKIHADRPYLFYVRERATGAILFMGRIANPSRS